MKKILIFLAIILFSSNSFAARPLSTEDSGTLGAGVWEAEAGAGYLETKEDGREGEIAAGIKYGVIDILDLGLEIPYVILNNEDHGVGDSSVSLKFNFLEESKSIPGTSIKIESTVLTGNKEKELMSEETEQAITLILSKKYYENSFHFNAGYSKPATGDDYTISYSIALEKPIIEDDSNFVLEVCGEIYNVDNESTDALWGQFGINWTLYDWLKADAGLTFGLGGEAPISGATLGLTSEF